MSGGRGEGGLSNEQAATVIVGCVLVALLFAKRGLVLDAASNWLHRHQILTDHEVLINIPHLGGLDLPRTVILAGVLITVVAVAGFAARRRRDTSSR